ncbi:MAG: histidinol-phosphate transaminase [Acidobacteria bacterium]|nr:histidinol-phosphate transaminase [Acidobacteriota bacterium]
MGTYLDRIRPEVRRSSGYSLDRPHAQVKIDQNESPYDLPLEVKQQIWDRVRDRQWSRYPELIPARLHEKLARLAGWKPDGILLGNGSNELILALLLAVVERGVRVVIPEPTFLLYRLLVEVLGGDVLPVPLRSDLSYDGEAILKTAVERDGALVVVCSPNNPTGGILAPDALEQVVRGCPGIVVLDEAYFEFAGMSGTSLLPRFENLVIFRTFSKAMSMAGMRIGYCLGHPALVAEMAKTKLPFNLNLFCLAAADVVLERPELLERRVRDIVSERERVSSALKRIPGVTVYPSYANFLLFETVHPPATVYQGLLSRGVLVRDVSRHHLLARALRASVGTPAENDQFLTALKSFLERA